MTKHGRDAPEPGRSTASNGWAAETPSRLDALLRRLASRGYIQHAIVAVERGDGSARWIGGVGEARPGGPPMDVHTPFFLASIDKLFTATVVMRLVEPPFRRLPPVIGHTGSTGSWLFSCPPLDVLLSGTVDQATAGAVPFRFVPHVLRALQEDYAFQPG